MITGTTPSAHMSRRAALLATLAIGGRGWRLRWADEFDGNSLNTSLWRAAANDSEAPPRWNQVRFMAMARAAQPC